MKNKILGIALGICILFSLFLLPSTTVPDLKYIHLPKTKVEGNKNMKVLTDIVYSKDHERNVLDFYIPQNTNTKFPILMFVHGGGWSTGDKSMYGHIGRHFAKHGFGTVVINYRLSPAFKHPAHVEDAAKAFAWVYDNAESHGGNKHQIFLMGHSSGAHTASLLSSNEEYLKVHKRSVQDIHKVVAVSGVYYINRLISIVGYNTVFNREDWHSASPINYVPKCKFFVLYAEKEYMTLSTQSKNYHAHLLNNNVSSQIMVANEVSHQGIIIEAANEEKPYVKEILKFLTAT